MQDSVNAFIETFTLQGAASGPLSGLTAGIKDLYDIQGHVTGCGSPDWAAASSPAAQTAPAVQALLDAGATVLGKTHTDEIAYSLMGVNAHYGTPINSRAPDRVPGGSSSGSAAATSAGLVDVGLGSDTGGSVRMPASFCGLYGIRTTQGAIDLANAMALAPSFDTAGWFARDAQTFARVGAAYGMAAPAEPGPVRLLIAQDAMALAGIAGEALTPLIQALEERFGEAERVSLNSNGPLAEWREVFKVCQAAEVWQVHGEWVTKAAPTFGPGVRERFQTAAAITPEMLADAKLKRDVITRRMVDLLGDDGVLLLPSSPGPGPLRDAAEAELDRFRMAALSMLCPGGLSGLPQISIPAGAVGGGPMGLSLMGPAHADGKLLSIAVGLV